MAIDSGAWSTAETTNDSGEPVPEFGKCSLKGPSPGIALVTHPGDAGRRGSVRQGWEEKIPKKIFFLLPWKRKGARDWTGHGGSPEHLRPTSTSPVRGQDGWAVHSQLQALWHRLPSVSGNHPPLSSQLRPGRAHQGRGLQAWPYRRLLPGSLTPGRLDSGPPPLQVPHPSRSPPSLLPRGAGSDEGIGAPA